jgi:hypothetical protein
VNDEYPYEIDNAVTEKLRSRDALAAWDALHELADAILDRAISLSAARPKLEARLLSLLKHLVDTGAPLTVDPELARRTIIERLRKPAALEDVLDEFRALVHDILAPCRFDDYLGVERQRLSAYLETIARKRLKRRSGATGTVDDNSKDRTSGIVGNTDRHFVTPVTAEPRASERVGEPRTRSPRGGRCA